MARRLGAAGVRFLEVARGSTPTLLPCLGLSTARPELRCSRSRVLTGPLQRRAATPVLEKGPAGGELL